MVYDYDGGDVAALVALRPIAVGECFSVAPSDSENEEDDSSDGDVDECSEDEEEGEGE